MTRVPAPVALAAVLLGALVERARTRREARAPAAEVAYWRRSMAAWEAYIDRLELDLAEADRTADKLAGRNERLRGQVLWLRGQLNEAEAEVAAYREAFPMAALSIDRQRSVN